MQAARELGAIIARQNRQMVYGAGSTGLMGAVADGALEAGGEVFGIINEGLNLDHLIHDGLTAIEVVDDIHTRQERMLELADAMIALPGGLGTYAEAIEALTWAQIGLHNKPLGLLNIEGYFDPFIQMLDHSIKWGYIYPEHRGLFVVSADPEELLQMLDTFTAPENMNRWIDRE